MQAKDHTKISQAVEYLIEQGKAIPAECNVQQLKHAKCFDLLIIGSGYGGAVAAARFALATKSESMPLQKGHSKKLAVAVFERGREISPGEFPNNFAQLVGEARIQRDNSGKITGKSDALFELRFGKTVNTLTGNGLGGGSLINAAVVEKPHPKIWNNPAWPRELRDASSLDQYFEIAKRGLGARKFSESAKEVAPQKVKQMRRLSKELGEKHFKELDLAIDADTCNSCGDCITGCNFNAKNTLAKTYLYDAALNGAELFTGATVSHLRQIEEERDASEKTWLVYFYLSAGKDHPSKQKLWCVKSKRVILSAGTIGSTEILQRTQHLQDELQFSKQLGQKFSCNGDMIWTGYHQDQAVDSIANLDTPYKERQVGPTIMSMIDLRDQEKPHVIQDASIPAALKQFYEELVTTNALAYRMIKNDIEARDSTLDPDAVSPSKMQHSATYLSMGVDRALGRIQFSASSKDNNTGVTGYSSIHWGTEEEPKVGEEVTKDNVCMDPIYTASEKSLKRVQKLEGVLLPNPLYRAAPKALLDQLAGSRALNSTMTVHPLGGCPMADTSLDGVVNHFGAVFRPQKDFMQPSSETYPGLYVLDGSIIPCAIGINPLLSIAAIAERACEFIAQREKLTLSGKASIQMNKDVPDMPELANPREKLEFSFQEQMTWKASKKSLITLDNYPNATLDEVRLLVNFHIGDEDIPSFLRDPQRIVNIEEAKITCKLSTYQTLEFPLKGTVQWLWERHEKTDQKFTHGFTRYLRSRALADVSARKDLCCITKWFLKVVIRLLNKRQATIPPPVGKLISSFSKDFANIYALATHTGGHRILGYSLSDEENNVEVIGTKNVNYGDASNIWRSLSELSTDLKIGQQQLQGLKLCLDWNQIFESNSFQLDAARGGITSNPDLWLDLISIFAFWGRALARIHFWTFRLPEVQQRKRHPHLPQSTDQILCTWHSIVLSDRQGQRIEIGLTHVEAINKVQVAKMELPPLIMIHGFGASGLQFVTPGNQVSMAEYFVHSGRDVWVAELRTSIALNRDLEDKSAQWSMDEVAIEDIPCLIKYVAEKSKSSQVDILAHCIGSAMFNIAVLSGRLMQDDGKTSLVRSAGLLQVGPIFTVSENNKLRGYFAYFLGQGFDLDFIDSTTDNESENAKNTLIDRLLASYPVPKEQIEDENEELCLFPVPPNNQWQANYFRSSAVFGRLFDIHLLSPEMINQLGDLLGRTNFKTFKQIIQCVLRNRLVDVDGKNCYVKPENFKKYYTFPVKFFYGEKNDVFGVWGIINSVRQMRAAHGYFDSPAGDAQIDIDLGDPNLYGPFSYQIFPQYGHLDPIIGKNASVDVYPHLTKFLNQQDNGFTDKPSEEPLFLRQAEYGPVIGWTRRETGRWISRCWLSARETAGTPMYVATYYQTNATGQIHDLRLTPIQDLNQFHYATIDIPIADTVDQTRSLHMSILHRGAQDGSGPAYTKLVWPGLSNQLKQHQTTHPHSTHQGHWADPKDVLSPVELLGNRQATEFESSIQEQINNLDPKGYKKLIERHSSKLQIQIPSNDRNSSRIALGSCRYSGTMIEQVRSNAPFEALLRQLNSEYRPELMLHIGDQVYLDATAGVADPSDIASVHSFYHRSLARRFNQEDLAAAQVMSTLPSYMIWDDHEIRDDWNQNDHARDQGKTAREKTAISAMLAYQWSHGPRNKATAQATFCTKFSSETIDFFLLDTRLERTGPFAQNAQMISDLQFSMLDAWLNEVKDNGRLHLLVSPSQIYAMEDAHPLRSDAWSSYPNCLRRLLALLRNVSDIGIVCGDLHLQALYSIDYFDRCEKIQQIPVIVASPLYAPYPFANPRNSIQPGCSRSLSQLSNDQSTKIRFLASNAEYQGFVQLQVMKSGSKWWAELFKVDGKTPLFNTTQEIQF